MSGAAYRINTECKPFESPMFPWEARIARLSDGAHCITLVGETEQEALNKAVAWMEHAAGNAGSGGVYFADEDGNLDPVTPAPETPATA